MEALEQGIRAFGGSRVFSGAMAMTPYQPYPAKVWGKHETQIPQKKPQGAVRFHMRPGQGRGLCVSFCLRLGCEGPGVQGEGKARNRTAWLLPGPPLAGWVTV